MKSARHQLILLGLLCMGLTWNDYLMPALYALAWWFCLKVGRGLLRLPPLAEVLLLVAGTVMGHSLAQMLGYSSHFAVGHGLALLQLGRLLRPLNRREQWFSLLIALFHLAVACTFLFDYRFLAVLIGALVTIPRALAEFSVTGQPAAEPANGLPSPPVRPSVAVADVMAVLAVMLVLFLAFPRGVMGGGLRLRVTRGGEESTLLDTVLDPASGGRAGAGRILFQVRGAELGYLRCYTLAEFDGQRWRLSGDDFRWRMIESGEFESAPPGVLERQLRIKNPAFLGRVLPVDGDVVRLKGTFFHRAYETRQGMVETDLVFSRQNNVCLYWIRRQPALRELRPHEAAVLTAHPPPSPRLRQWLDQRLGGETNAYHQARLLESYLERNFTYQIGAPDLNRLNPLEDFLFNQRTGHCERFAAALAQLLRLQGIPTRVAIGYLPRTSNPLSGWYDIRLRDAHAWTEAWFPDRGWVRFDATPAATLPPPSAWSDWLEALDFAWYAHVVNFDRPSQSALLDGLWQGTTRVYELCVGWGQRLRPYAPWALVVFLLPAVWLVRRRLSWRFWRGKATENPESARALAGHYYGRMLRLLERQGFRRAPHQTPLEFLATLEAASLPGVEAARHITQIFCLTHYGGQPMPAGEQSQIERALKRVEAMNDARKS